MFGAITFFSTYARGLFTVRYRSEFGMIAAFAAGVLIAVPLFVILPETLNLASGLNIQFEYLMYIIALGFFLSLSFS